MGLIKKIDILMQKGPKRDLCIEHGPKDKLSKRFSAASYNRFVSNGEKCDREWLVYSYGCIGRKKGSMDHHFPVTVASAERSFSKLRLLKSYCVLL
jgi:hypothetical protein